VFVVVVKALGNYYTPSVPTPQTPTTIGLDVIVNGVRETAATSTKTYVDGKAQLAVDVNEDVVSKKMDAVLAENTDNKTDNIIEVPIISANSDKVDVGLNGQIVKKMEDNNFKLNVHINNISYILPASEVNISDIAQSLNSESNLKDIEINVRVESITSSMNAGIAQNAKTGSYELVIPAVNFEITATSKTTGKSVSINHFAQYVAREFEIPAGIDPNKITTGVVVDLDGKVRHEPTKITMVNGKYYAKINSLTNSPYTVVWHPLEFKDIKENWAEKAINDMGSRMVIEGVGDGNYEPDRDITRAEFAAIIVKALGIKSGLGENKFSDVTSTAWYCDYVKTASEYKIIEGYGKGKFGPMDNISREQAMTMISNAMKTTGLKINLNDSEISKLFASFDMQGSAAKWAAKHIAVCIKSGVVSKNDGKMNAIKGNVTHAEVAVIVRNLLQKSELIN